MFLVNSRQGNFRCGLTKRSGRASPEVTPAFLPSSLRRTHSFALGFSPQPPVSVFRYRHHTFILRGFSWKALRRSCPEKIRAPLLSRLLPFKAEFRIFLELQPSLKRKSNHHDSSAYFLRHPIGKCGGAGILTSFPSASPFGYTLGPD